MQLQVRQYYLEILMSNQDSPYFHCVEKKQLCPQINKGKEKKIISVKFETTNRDHTQKTASCRKYWYN